MYTPGTETYLSPSQAQWPPCQTLPDGAGGEDTLSTIGAGGAIPTTKPTLAMLELGASVSAA